ncbi:hypothetical protein YTPLAS72_36470 [Nitrospira sp.]|nr:hypothetical protein YTPLAS72_36470 [Nitrospira sp.]
MRRTGHERAGLQESVILGKEVTIAALRNDIPSRWIHSLGHECGWNRYGRDSGCLDLAYEWDRIAVDPLGDKGHYPGVLTDQIHLGIH